MPLIVGSPEEDNIRPTRTRIPRREQVLFGTLGLVAALTIGAACSQLDTFAVNAALSRCIQQRSGRNETESLGTSRQICTDSLAARLRTR